VYNNDVHVWYPLPITYVNLLNLSQNKHALNSCSEPSAEASNEMKNRLRQNLCILLQVIQVHPLSLKIKENKRSNEDRQTRDATRLNSVSASGSVRSPDHRHHLGTGWKCTPYWIKTMGVDPSNCALESSSGDSDIQLTFWKWLNKVLETWLKFEPSKYEALNSNWIRISTKIRRDFAISSQPRFQNTSNTINILLCWMGPSV
jgi:hypothetical protein